MFAQSSWKFDFPETFLHACLPKRVHNTRTCSSSMGDSVRPNLRHSRTYVCAWQNKITIIPSGKIRYEISSLDRKQRFHQIGNDDLSSPFLKYFIQNFVCRWIIIRVPSSEIFYTLESYHIVSKIKITWFK